MDSVQIFQMNDAQSIAEYAYRTVPLYIDIAEEKDIKEIDFSLLPIVGKEEYLNPETTSLSIDYITRYLNNELLVGKTSGSTGKVTDFYWYPSDEKKSLFELWYYRTKYYHIFPDDKMVFFFPISTDKEEVTYK